MPEHPRMAGEILRELHRRKLTGEGTMPTVDLEGRMAVYAFEEFQEAIAQTNPEAAAWGKRFEAEAIKMGRKMAQAQAHSSRDEVLARAATAMAQRCPKCEVGRAYVLHFPDGVDRTRCAACDYGWPA